MLTQAEKNYLPMVVNFVQGRLEVIDDVLADPLLYAYPVATIAIALQLAGKDVATELPRRIGDRKFYDGTPKRIAEILKKYSSHD